MSNPVDREGVFRGEIVEYGLKQMDSGAVAVGVVVNLTDLWDADNQTWHPWFDYAMSAPGDIWIVKTDAKGGGINQRAAESLIRFAGWDGNLESITGQTWKPTPVQVTIKAEEYQGATNRRVAFVNDWARVPGSVGNVDETKAKELQTRFGGQLRAIAGNARRSVPAPQTSRPATPPPPATAVVGATSANGAAGSEDIPF